MTTTRLTKFNKLLSEPVVNLEALKELCWSGIPPHHRSLCWRLLLGYLPPNKDRRSEILERRRREYRDMVPDYYDSVAAAAASSPPSSLSAIAAAAADVVEDGGALRQVAVDVPRTAPGVPFFHIPQVQKSLERILYIWGVRHPASGYVQGINDLVTPFLAVFMSEHMQDVGPIETWADESSALPSPESFLDVEADSYWCLCKLLDSIQDHYTYAQPGIQRMLFHVRELVRRVDEPLAQQLDKEGLDFIQFAFRWVNCLLLREVPFHLGIRLWDTYLSEGGSGLKGFLVYVLGSFLLSWQDELRGMEFQELIMFLQRLPTGEWEEKDIETVLSRAHCWRISFVGTGHFQ
jgi:TBC1 domain family member 2